MSAGLRWTLVLALAGLLGGGFLWMRQRPSLKTFSPGDAEELPESKTAYQTGGRPLSLGTAGDSLFGDDLPAFVIALDRYARDRSPTTEAVLNDAETRLLRSEHQALVGAEVFAALAHVTEACRATLEDGEPPAGDIAELNQELATAGLGYHLEADTIEHDNGTSPLIYSYVVERVRLFDVDADQAERVLWLRRLDRINFKTDLLGSNDSDDPAAVVRRALIDEVVHEDLLPVLADEASYDVWRTPPTQRADQEAALEAAVGAKLRDDFSSAGMRREDARELAKLLQERARLFDTMRSRARADGLTVAVPAGYRFDMAPYAQLSKVVGQRILRELEDIDEALGSEPMAKVYRAVRATYVHSIEFHELQHRLDDRRTPRVPAVLTRHVRPGDDGSLGAFDARLVTELSAYLAELGNSETPFVVLAELSKHAFNRQPGERLYALAAIAVIESLCEAAGIEHADLIDQGAIERGHLAETLTALLELSPVELRNAAANAWHEAFAADLAHPRARAALSSSAARSSAATREATRRRKTSRKASANSSVTTA